MSQTALRGSGWDIARSVYPSEGTETTSYYKIICKHILNEATRRSPLALARGRVERCFEDQKSEIGLDQHEGRRCRGLQRHMPISAVSYLFLARVRQGGGGKSGVDGVPTPHGDGGFDPVVVGGRWPASARMLEKVDKKMSVL